MMTGYKKGAFHNVPFSIGYYFMELKLGFAAKVGFFWELLAYFVGNVWRKSCLLCAMVNDGV